MVKNLRGSGVRHTAPMVGRFAGLWLLVTLAAVAVASVTSYLALQTRGGARGADGSMLGALLLQTALTVGAVAALAVFTTHRLAGPWIAVRRALEGVRDGDLETQLRIRSVDPHLREIERAFNEMTDALRRGRSDAA
jgi:nitrogen fixation/metabolism regulation signal transduction histidine kinase